MTRDEHRRALARERQRRCRARRAAGRVVLTLELDDTVADALVDARLVPLDQSFDDDALERALQRVVDHWSSTVTRDRAINPDEVES